MPASRDNRVCLHAGFNRNMVSDNKQTNIHATCRDFRTCMDNALHDDGNFAIPSMEQEVQTQEKSDNPLFYTACPQCAVVNTLLRPACAMACIRKHNTPMGIH